MLKELKGQCCWSIVNEGKSGVREDETGSMGQITEDHISHNKELRYDSGYNGDHLEHFKWNNKVIQFIFRKITLPAQKWIAFGGMGECGWQEQQWSNQSEGCCCGLGKTCWIRQEL